MAIKGNVGNFKASFAAGDACKTTTSQYKAVYISGSMTVSICSNSADNVIGIIDSFQSAGSNVVTVIMHGIATGCMLSGTTAAIGTWLVATTQGCLIPALTNTTALQKCIGVLLDVPGSGGAATVYVNPHIAGTVV